MRPSILIATAISGIVVALGVVALLKSPTQSNVDQGPEETLTGRPSAFYLDVDADQRRAILENTLYRIASDRPERLGPLKEDIALLLDDPASIQWLVAQWHLGRSSGKYAEAAFADIFRLVKHKDFVEPTAELLLSTYPEIRTKGLQAAQTQADPRLGPKVLAIYRAAAAEPVSRKTQTKLEAVRASHACGGDALTALLTEAFLDENPDLAVEALTIAADMDTPGADGEAKRILQTSTDRRVRLHAAALLARRGDMSAREDVIAALDPADQGLATDAAHIVGKYKMTAAAEKLREFRAKANGETQRVLTLALLRLGNRAVWDEMILAADTPGDREIEALQLLAASADPNAAPILLHAIDRGGPARVRAIAAGISTAPDPGFLPVVERLIEQPVGHPVELGEAPKAGGKALVPRLAQLLRDATEPAAQLRYMSWLSLIGGKEARDVILSERPRIGRFADQQLRLIDLEARRLGVEAPPLSAN